MLTHMYLCVAVFTVAIICYLFTQELNQLITIWMHFNLMHERVQKEVERGFIHRRQWIGLDGCDGLRREYTQQIRASRQQLVVGLCFPLRAYACRYAL